MIFIFKHASSLLMLLVLCSCSQQTSINENKDVEEEKEAVPAAEIISNVVKDKALASQEEEFFKVCDGLEVNKKPGIYSDSFDLEFKITSQTGKLYYTINNGTPEFIEDNLYEEPIEISSAVRSLDQYPLTTSVDGILSWCDSNKCYSSIYVDNVQNQKKYRLSPLQNSITITYVDDAKGTSYTTAMTYLINEDINYYTIPVVCLTMPVDEWFGEEDFYNQIRTELERWGELEYFDFVNGEYFERNTKIKIGGNWSKGYPQRTLNLNFNKNKDGVKQTPVSAHIYGDDLKDNGEGRIDEITRFRLHNSGNSFESYTGFNDALIQEMMEGTNCATTNYRPCITYLNGEYWGIYYIREAYSDTFIADNYDVKKSKVLLAELKGSVTFDDGDDTNAQELIDEVFNYLGQDFHDDAIYNEFITKYIDVDSLIDLFIAESYAGNWDFVGNNNNLKMWRVTKVDESNPYADGKWRFGMHDVDFAFTDNRIFINPSCGNSYYNWRMFRYLLKNDGFRERMYNRACELLATNLSAENAINTLDRMVNEVSAYKVDAAYRWGWNKDDYYYTWQNNINGTYDFFMNREANYLDALKIALSRY